MTKFGVFTLDGFTWIARPAHPDDDWSDSDTAEDAVKVATKLPIDQPGPAYFHHVQDQTDGSHGLVPHEGGDQ